MDKLERLATLLREPSKEMVEVGITVADDCKESYWDSGGDGEKPQQLRVFQIGCADHHIQGDGRRRARRN